MLEVEVKHRVDPPDGLESLRRTFVQRFGAVFRTVEETDTYFNAPDRDFAQTDEALRLRRRRAVHGMSDENGDENDSKAYGSRTELFLTYKGPKLDPATKTRHEIDLPLGNAAGVFSAAATADQYMQFRSLLLSLGYRVAGTVKKVREKANIEWRGEAVEISLDRLAALERAERPATFCELEILANTDRLDAARAKLFELANESGLPSPDHQIRQSYLGMVLECEDGGTEAV